VGPVKFRCWSEQARVLTGEIIPKSTNRRKAKEKYNMTTTTAIQTTAVEPTFVLTADEIEQALEVQREHELLLVAHPLKADRALHHAGECDGACLRFRCFRV
jgi:hypothetical protein